MPARARRWTKRSTDVPSAAHSCWASALAPGSTQDTAHGPRAAVTTLGTEAQVPLQPALGLHSQDRHTGLPHRPYPSSGVAQPLSLSPWRSACSWEPVGLLPWVRPRPLLSSKCSGKDCPAPHLGVALFLLHLWPPPASYPGNSSWVPSSWHHQASLRSDTSILSGPLTATPRAGPAPPAPSLPHPTPVALIWGSGLCVTPHCSTYGPRDSIRKKDLWDTKEHGSRAHTGATQLEPLLMENAQQATQAP